MSNTTGYLFIMLFMFLFRRVKKGPKPLLMKWLRVKDSNLRPLGYEPNSLTADVTRYIWYKWPESNRHARYRRQSLSLLWLPITPLEH